MALGLIGKKVGMTRLFDQESGAMVPVTVIDVKGNTFAQIKTEDKDGYNAIQVAFDAQKESRVAKPQAGHFKKLGIQPTKLLKEFRVEASELPAEGAEDPGVDLFSAGQWVDVIGTSKGKGFQGAMRRHNFHGSPAAHGSMMHRRTGGVGGCSTPGRVWKNQKMPGQMGHKRITIQNLEVVKVDPELNMLVVCGAIPGPKGGLVTIKSTVKVHKVKQAGADISKNPQKASGRNPQKASARNK